MVEDGHWVRWHEGYADPSSSLSRRLATVQRRLHDALDVAHPGPVRLISMCSGQGRDVIPVVAHHPRRDDVRARLVDLDPVLVADARSATEAAGLAHIEIVCGDAADTTVYEDLLPAQVVLVCGVFGNISDADVRAIVLELPRLCAPGATVIWTRHRRPPDHTPEIRRRFTDAGFDEVAFDAEPESAFGVGTSRFSGTPEPYRPNPQLFHFIGDGLSATS